MFEARMQGGREHQVSRSKLFNAAKTLEFRGVDQLDFERAELNIPVDRIPNQLPRHLLPAAPYRACIRSAHEGDIVLSLCFLLRFFALRILGGRPTVGPQTLNLLIGVRIPASKFSRKQFR